MGVLETLPDISCLFTQTQDCLERMLRGQERSLVTSTDFFGGQNL